MAKNTSSAFPVEVSREIETSLLAFSSITGLPVTFYDDKCQVKSEYGSQYKICKFLRIYNREGSVCRHHLMSALKTAASLGEPYFFVCAAGFVNVAVPLIQGGAQYGCFIAGPIIMEKFSPRTISKLLALNLSGETAVSEKDMEHHADFLSRVVAILRDMYVYSSKQVAHLAILLNNSIVANLPDKSDYDRANARYREQVQIGDDLRGLKRSGTVAARLMARSRRPVFYVGGGVNRARAWDELAELVELTGIPVVTTLMARGALPDSHALNYGMPGMHGTVAAVGALQRADLLITLGARFDDRVTGKLDSFAPDAKVIHADIDPAEISKNRVADVPIVGDLAEVITDLHNVLLQTKLGKPEEWVRYLDGLRDRYTTSSYDPIEDGLLSPEYVIQRIGAVAVVLRGHAEHRRVRRGSSHVVRRERTAVVEPDVRPQREAPGRRAGWNAASAGRRRGRSARGRPAASRSRSSTSRRSPCPRRRAGPG